MLWYSFTTVPKKVLQMPTCRSPFTLNPWFKISFYVKFHFHLCLYKYWFFLLLLWDAAVLTTTCYFSWQCHSSRSWFDLFYILFCFQICRQRSTLDILSHQAKVCHVGPRVRHFWTFRIIWMVLKTWLKPENHIFMRNCHPHQQITNLPLQTSKQWCVQAKHPFSP